MKINLDKLHLKNQIAIVIVTVSAIILPCYWLIFLPRQAHIAKLTEQYHHTKRDIEVAESFAMSHPDIERYLLDLDNKITLVNKMMPNDADIGNFLVYIENTSKASGLELVQLQPGVAINKNGYREIPVEILVKGNYFQTLQFLSKLESLPRFSAVNNVLIQARSGVLENKLSIVIYSYGIANINQPGSGTR